MIGITAARIHVGVPIAGPSRLAFRARPRTLPRISLPPSYNQIPCRSFIIKRQLSSSTFWSPSFPPDSPPTSLAPKLGEEHFNNVPIVTHISPGGDTQSKDGSRNQKRKQKFLDSLMDKAGEMSLKCSILNAEGQWAAEEGRYKKSELCREYDLDPRDLRKLDSLQPNLVPLILTRRSCILISMLHLRVLIKPDQVIVFETAGSVESEMQRRFKWHLEKNVRSGLMSLEEADKAEDIGILSYEHRALESVLVATANALEEEMAFTRQVVQHLLADLEDHIDRDNLKRLLHYSRRMVGFQSRARYVKRAVDEVLESDEDLSAMYLSSKAIGRPRALHDHEQLELLLESFVKQVEEIVSEVDTTVTNMQSTQEIAELMLDSGRNALLALDVKISVATLGVGSGALVAGLFGMNLTTTLESNPYAFWVVTSCAACVTLLICVIGMRVMRRVRRVALSGYDPTPLQRRIPRRPRGMPPAPPIPSMVDPRTDPRFTARMQGNALMLKAFRRKAWYERFPRLLARKAEPTWMGKPSGDICPKDLPTVDGFDVNGEHHGIVKDLLGPERWETAWANKWGSSHKISSRWAKE